MEREKKAIILKIVPAIVVLFALLVSSSSAVEDPAKFPMRPITMIVQWAAGGTSDLTARKLAELAGNILGQRIVVENKLGGGGVVGTAIVRSLRSHTSVLSPITRKKTSPG
jgi:tripartite-type tricarboxylate transporter receptor subunit TctC